MSLEEVFGSIELSEPGKDLDRIIEEAKEEHSERALEKYYDVDAYPQITRIEPL